MSTEQTDVCVSEDAFRALATHLRDERDAVLREWRDRVHADAALDEARRLTNDEFFNNAASILDLVERALLGDESQPSDGDLTAGHGTHRFEAGYEFDEVIRELGILREVLAEVASAFLSRSDLETARVADQAHIVICRSLNETTNAVARAYSDARRAIEEELKLANARLRQQDTQKSRFISTVAHELRSPLNVIAGVSQILVRSRDRLGEQAKLADMLDRNVESLIHLINDLLDYSRVATGREALALEEIDPCAVVEAAVEPLRIEAVKKGLVLRVERGQAPPTVVTDRLKIGRIVTNLVSNAIKFTDENGEIVVRIVARGAATWRLEVRDTGIGIDEANLGRIFDEFVRLDRNRHGTGLGLPIVKRLVESLGGAVDAASEPGRGTTFCLDFPRVARETHAAHEDGHGRPDASS